MRLVIGFLILLLANSAFAGLFTIEKKRLSSKLKVSEFNEISSSYNERPTFVELRKLGSKDVIFIDYTPYRKDNLNTAIFISKPAVDDALAYIAKYKQWNEQAKANSDAFEKDIGKIPTASGLGALFAFYSGNAQNHYLVIFDCSLGICSRDDKRFIDEKNVNELELLLTDFKNDKLILEDVSQKYN